MSTGDEETVGHLRLCGRRRASHALYTRPADQPSTPPWSSAGSASAGSGVVASASAAIPDPGAAGGAAAAPAGVGLDESAALHAAAVALVEELPGGTHSRPLCELSSSERSTTHRIVCL